MALKTMRLNKINSETGQTLRRQSWSTFIDLTFNALLTNSADDKVITVLFSIQIDYLHEMSNFIFWKSRPSLHAYVKRNFIPEFSLYYLQLDVKIKRLRQSLHHLYKRKSEESQLT